MTGRFTLATQQSKTLWMRRAGTRTWRPYKFYLESFIPKICAVACTGTSNYNRKHPGKDGEYMECKFSVAYTMYENGEPHCLYSSIYSRVYDASFVINFGQSRSDSSISMRNGYGFIRRYGNDSTCLTTSKQTVTGNPIKTSTRTRTTLSTKTSTTLSPCLLPRLLPSPITQLQRALLAQRPTAGLSRCPPPPLSPSKQIFNRLFLSRPLWPLARQSSPWAQPRLPPTKPPPRLQT